MGAAVISLSASGFLVGRNCAGSQCVNGERYDPNPPPTVFAADDAREWRGDYHDLGVALGTAPDGIEITDRRGHTVCLDWADAALIARTILDVRAPR
jgi:hypothetical protein